MISKKIQVVADGRLYANVSLTCSETATSVANNTSTIKWTVSAAQVSSSVIGFSGTTRNSAAVVKAYVNGVCVMSKALALAHMSSSNSWTQTGTATVTHNADGNKTITVSLIIDRGAGNYSNDPWTYSGASGSESMKLAFIARAAGISCPALTLGSASTLTISSACSDFAYLVRYEFLQAAEEISPTTNQTSIAWTPPLSLASQIPNDTSGTMTIFCDTYYSGSKIGTKSIQVKVKVPDSVKPVIGSLSADPVNPDAISSWGVFVQTKSKAEVKVNDAQGAYGSTISSYAIKGGGFQGSTADFTTGLLNSSGDVVFTATVTDSRGRTSDPATVTITVEPYKPPVISKYSAERCVADGSPSDDGTCVLANVTFSISGCAGKNTASTKVRYRAAGTSAWTDASSPFETGVNFVFGSASVSTETSYDIEFSVTDALETTTIIAVLSTAAVLLDFKAEGKGFAIGKVSEKETAFEVNPTWDVWVHGKEILDLMRDTLYPVGSIYLSVSSTNPKSLFGGTWKQISQGRFLLGQSTDYAAESTGGEATHKLTESEIPEHTHLINMTSTSSEVEGFGLVKTNQQGFVDRVYVTKGSTDPATATESAGTDGYHNNMPPYFVCFMWQRTA